MSHDIIALIGYICITSLLYLMYSYFNKGDDKTSTFVGYFLILFWPGFIITAPVVIPLCGAIKLGKYFQIKQAERKLRGK